MGIISELLEISTGAKHVVRRARNPVVILNL